MKVLGDFLHNRALQGPRIIDIGAGKSAIDDVHMGLGRRCTIESQLVIVSESSIERLKDRPLQHQRTTFGHIPGFPHCPKLEGLYPDV